jgi:hypothetical protein
MRRPSHAAVVAYLALLVATTGTAAAATGGLFTLGKANQETSKASLANSSGTPLALSARTGYPPLDVNTTKKVHHLNADLLDGVSAQALQRRVTQYCGRQYSISKILASGQVQCVRPTLQTGYALGSVISNGDGTASGGLTCGRSDDPGDTAIAVGVATWDGGNHDYIVRSYPTQSADSLNGHYDGWHLDIAAGDGIAVDRFSFMVECLYYSTDTLPVPSP